MDMKQHKIYPPIKRLIDVVVSLIVLIGLSPFLLVVALMILADMGRPVLFVQLRPGKSGKPFRLYKFRTMRTFGAGKTSLSGGGVGISSVKAVASDEDRITKLGSFLRATSIDEIPEFFNVLKGDMSLVGPRPLLMEYLELYSQEQARRHEVCPGITGLAQVSGRNLLSWEERFRLDVEYVDTYSFMLDLKIACETIKTVFSREGVSSKTSATMEPFRGSDAKIDEL